jgi:hypothetical protein
MLISKPLKCSFSESCQPRFTFKVTKVEKLYISFTFLITFSNFFNSIWISIKFCIFMPLLSF